MMLSGSQDIMLAVIKVTAGAVVGVAVSTWLSRLRCTRAPFATPADTPDLETLAAQQGVRPITSIEELRADFWPEGETTEELLATLDRWRHEDSGTRVPHA